MMDENLRRQSVALLQALRVNQNDLQALVRTASSHEQLNKQHLSKYTEVSNDPVHLNLQENQQSTADMISDNTVGGDESKATFVCRKFSVIDSSNAAPEAYKSRTGSRSQIKLDSKVNCIDPAEVSIMQSPDDSPDVHSNIMHTHYSDRTPTTIQRRQIVSRNVHMRADAPEHYNVINRQERNSQRSLQFSQAENEHKTLVNDSDRCKANASREGYEDVDPPETMHSHAVDKNEIQEKYNFDKNYVKKLAAAGNDKRLACSVHHATTNKTKSCFLNSSRPKNSHVQFRSPDGSGFVSSSFLEQKTNPQLLGYDWIASLLDNHAGFVDSSESFFEDLREFRRVNKEECVKHVHNDALASSEEYMSPIKTIMDEHNLKPYGVNDRLFTVPIKTDLLADFIGEKTKSEKAKKEPTDASPRFVRVSIPRSTLLSPHRMKPHRRQSFDPTDSVSLGQHCLLGWESSRPSMLPSASTVALTHSSKGIKSKVTTTMEEADKIASSFLRSHPSLLGNQESRLPRRQALDSLLQLRNTDLLNASRGLGGNRLDSVTAAADASHVSRGSGYPAFSNVNLSKSYGLTSEDTLLNSSGVNKMSEDLLNSTYSLMYEMQRLKQERDVQQRRLKQIQENQKANQLTA